MDIDAIKSTPLGRAWLAAFVRRVWELMPGSAATTLVERTRRSPWTDFALAYKDDDCSAGRLYIARVRAFEECLAPLVRSDTGFLTPLGVEVYLYGRKQARKRADR
jgi:hypothetical protein